MCNIGRMALMKSIQSVLSMTLRSSEILSHGQLTVFKFEGFLLIKTKPGNGVSLFASRPSMTTHPRPGSSSPWSSQPWCVWPACFSLAASPCSGSSTRRPSTPSALGTRFPSTWKSFWATLITASFCFSPSRSLMRVKFLTNWVSSQKSLKAASSLWTAAASGPLLGRTCPHASLWGGSPLCWTQGPPTSHGCL